MRERVGAGSRAAVVGIQRQACHLGLDGDPLVILSAPGVPLAPNGVAVGVAPDLTMPDAGFRVGQMVVLSDEDPGVCDADWLVVLTDALTWEPRPDIRRLTPGKLDDRLWAARAVAIADGAGGSLLPLLWTTDGGAVARLDVARVASGPARRLCEAAARGDAPGVAAAASRLAGLGPGLTPSGDDLLSGFAAAWTLVGESQGLDGPARSEVSYALVRGARRGASPLGRVWLEYANRGELPEPVTRVVDALFAADPRDLGPAVRTLLTVGASSGTDWAVGLLLGARAALAAANGMPAWW